MKLLFVIDHFGSGGAQRQMTYLGCGMAERGHRVEFFVYHPGRRHFAGEVERRGIPVHAVRRGQRLPLGVVTGLRRLLVEGAFDGVLAFLGASCLYAELATIGLPVPLVVSERGALPDSGPSPLRRLRLELHRTADVITVNSFRQRDRLVDRFDWMKGKVRVIPNGVDLDRFAPAPSPGGDTRRERLELVALATVRPLKNAVGLARALSVYRESHGRPPLVRWVGKWGRTETSAGAYARARAEIARLDLDSDWEWLGERSDVPELLARHDALVHPSVSEGMTNAVVEALACGRPVLAGRIGDHELLVQEGTTGHLFDPRNPESIAAAIHRFAVATPERRREMGTCARAFAEREFSIARLVDRYEALFLELVAPGGPH